MTAYEKKRKAAMVAVAYYLEQEAKQNEQSNNVTRTCCWSRTGKEMSMSKRQIIQRRGRVLHSA